MQQPSCEKASRPKIGANAPARCLTCRTRRNSTRPAPRCSAASTNAQPEQATAPPSMKRVPGPVHAVAVTPWRESRARPWTTALPTAQGYGQPLRGSAVAHRLPTSFAFGLTRRCASCPNDTHHRSFPRHRYSHRYTLPIYNGSTRFALPIPGCFRLIPELEKTLLLAPRPRVNSNPQLPCLRCGLHCRASRFRLPLKVGRLQVDRNGRESTRLAFGDSNDSLTSVIEDLE